MLRQFLSYLQRVQSESAFLKMAESLVSLGKRRLDDTDKVDSNSDLSSKKKKKKQQKVQLGKSEGCKRKIAMLVAYNGAGYYGVQVNPGFRTIESEIFPALVNIGAIPQDHADTPSKMWFQRGSRTDKGVSAVGQIFSLKIFKHPESENTNNENKPKSQIDVTLESATRKAVLVPDLVTKLNEILPPQIRVISYVRTTNGFDSKNWCDSRTYMYMTPTYAFAPYTKFITEEYRTTDVVLEQVRTILSKFVGTHKFHNFTSGVKYEQASASRYIMKFECSEPYVREGIEFVTIQVKGQSFMLHHIRKMMGLTIAIARGYCGESAIEASWGPDKVDIPRAPGLGLVLEALHVDHYNKKFGSDGMHEPIEWSQYQEIVDKFKDEQIISHIVSQEKTDRVMFNWLRTLQFHNFDQQRLDGQQRPWGPFLKSISKKSSEQSESLDAPPAAVVSDVPSLDAPPATVVSDVPSLDAPPATVVSDVPSLDAPPATVVSDVPSLDAPPATVVSDVPNLDAPSATVVSDVPNLDAPPATVVFDKVPSDVAETMEKENVTAGCPLSGTPDVCEHLSSVATQNSTVNSSTDELCHQPVLTTDASDSQPVSSASTQVTAEDSQSTAQSSV